MQGVKKTKGEEDFQKVLDEIDRILSDPKEVDRRFKISIEAYMRKRRHRR